MSELIFSQSPCINIASNTFINVPVILRYENLNLIEVIKDLEIGYCTQIPIFHPDGTKLAVAKNSRIFNTPDGVKAGVKIEKYPGLWVCKMENKDLFEIRQQGPDLFKTTAELYTNDGFFVKCTDNPQVGLFDKNASALAIKGITLSGNTFSNIKIGIDIKKDGSIHIAGF